MGFTRQSFKGSNSVEPADTNKQGQGSGISNTGIAILNNPEETNELLHVYSGPKKTLPGGFKFNQMTGVKFNDSDWDSGTGKFNKDNISRWFRDDGNTTT